MKTIRIQNLRSLRDSGDLEISPITILLGKNSAGKSTFLRSFPLLRQSSEEKTINDILWFGDYVDFGTFWDSLSNNASKPEISFSFSISHSLRNLIAYSGHRSIQHNRRFQGVWLNYNFELRQTAESFDQESQILSTYEIRSEDNFATMVVDKDLSIKKLTVNGEDLSEQIGAHRVTRQTQLLPNYYLGADEDFFDEMIVRDLRWLSHHKTTDQSLMGVAEGLIFGPREFVLWQLSSAGLGAHWDQQIKALNVDSDVLCRIHRTLFGKYLGLTYDALNSTLTETFANVRYITPLRATAERYYRQRAIAVDEIAPNGDNVAMFLKNLSELEAQDFAQWTASNMGFAVLVESHKGHVSLVIEDVQDRTRINLADVGFGYSQVIPILAQVWQISRQRQTTRSGLALPRQLKSSAPFIFLIEQPELHLHPRMQARLMELFFKVAESAKKEQIDLRIVIETHSETMVSKAGQMLFNSTDLSSDEVSIYIFDKRASDSERGTQITKSWFDSEGLLLNWPYDFFDGSKP